jgi:putative membrane protein
MSTRNRIVLATLALLSVGAFVLATYAADNEQANPNQNQPNQIQPNQNPPNTFQPGTTQPGARQPGTNPAMPYQVNRVPSTAGQGEVGMINQQGKQNVDLFLIPCLINANNAEVTLGNIATQKAQSKDVKDFAQELVKDHTAALKQFQQLQTTLTQQLRPQNPNNTPVAAALFEINQEIEQSCLASAQRELEQVSSSDFDRCYIGMQVGMHMQLSSVVSVLKNHVTSPDFKKAIEDLAQLDSRHLESAKKIMKDLERGENRSSGTVNR